jgi:cytochrome c-type biogenesis protein CcmF
MRDECDLSSSGAARYSINGDTKLPSPMMAETGLAALWLAAALALLQALLSALSLLRERDDLARAIRPVATVQGAMAAIAMAALISCFMASDMSVALVAANSHSMKPWLYKFAGAWGNHEGSMLLWVTILGLAGAAVALLERRLPARTLTATLGAQAVIALGFYAFLLFASNPFARLSPAPADGAGLNPLLQDPGLAFHPPTLYAGYVGLSVAFSFAVGALVTRDVGPTFARAMRPWVLGAWVFLTLGITAGSYWAYYELGWGGWWFWDPVENASLMPWLAATALLHSVSVLATRDGLRAWTVMLAVVAFSMSMIGTFLVRSGILTSVHAFAVDPTRGTFILALLVLYIGGALALFGARIGTVRQGQLFEPFSREGALVANNLLLTVILGIVLIGTFYPLVAAAMGTQLSVGPPFFNAAAGPIALALVAIMAAGPVMRWRRDAGGDVLERLMWPIAAALAAGAGVFVLAGPVGALPLAGIALAAGLAVASVAPLARRNPWRAPLFTWGMVVAHLGIAVSLMGMAASSAFTQETLLAVGIGTPARVGGFTVRLEGVRPLVGDNWTALEARLAVTDGDDAFVLRPQVRYFTDPVTSTNESAIATLWSGQLYTVLGALGEDGRWQLRLWWKPFVTLIWAGGALVAIGGALSLLGHERRHRRQAKRREEAWS